MTEPFHISGRVVNLRTMIAGDVADYDRWSDPQLRAWQFDGPWFKDDVSDLALSSRRRLAQGQRAPYKRLEIETHDSLHIGWTVVYVRDDDPHMTEVGIDIVEEACWGQGLGTEALALWVDYQFRARNLTRIGFSTWSGNPRMIRVGEKLGFQIEGRIRNGCEVRGAFYDRVKMGILRAEWSPVAARLGLG